MNTKLRIVSFSPPDMSEAENTQVVDALNSGWITTDPKTKEFEHQIAAPLHTKLTDEDVDYVISNYVDIIKSL